MPELRAIRSEELELLGCFLRQIDKKLSDFSPISLVDDYENAVMGSIGLGDAQNATYAGDLVQGTYVDSDSVPVVITLTHDTEGKLLDLDFWKEDFSKLRIYPKPQDISFSS